MSIFQHIFCLFYGKKKLKTPLMREIKIQLGKNEKTRASRFTREEDPEEDNDEIINNSTTIKKIQIMKMIMNRRLQIKGKITQSLYLE